jgi:hypothetical protein
MTRTGCAWRGRVPHTRARDCVKPERRAPDGTSWPPEIWEAAGRGSQRCFGAALPEAESSMKSDSRKRSRRRTVILGVTISRPRVIGALVICGAAAGVYWFAGGHSQAEAEARDKAGISTVEQRAADAASAGQTQTTTVGPSEAEVDKLVREINAEVRPLKSQARQDAFRRGYERVAKVLEGPMEVGVRQKLLPFFNQLTDQLFFSTFRNDFCDVYVTKPGDAVSKIAKLHGITEELICLWNDIAWDKRARIGVNVPLKILKGRPAVIVSKSECTLSYYFGDLLARQYVVAHGKGNNTPTGAVSVISKEVDPDTGPNKGSAQREMDERWIGLSAFEEGGATRNGIGIHGTKYEDSIPGETSMGCVRMFNKDVVELYNWVPYGMKVEIRA